ncbi:MAG: hypothetical protein PSX81_00880 [bacterium]|nr:hypothetical protein [bacterium]
MRNTNLNKDILGFLLMVFLILLGFKISGSVIAINWSWWIISSPLFIYLVLNLGAYKNAIGKHDSYQNPINQ